jgi:hypothetical protein
MEGFISIVNIYRKLAEIVLKNELREYIDPIEQQDYSLFVDLLASMGDYSITNFRSMYYRLYVENAQTKVSLINELTDFGYTTGRRVCG